MRTCMDCGKPIDPMDYPERYRETARTTARRCAHCTAACIWEWFEREPSARREKEDGFLPSAGECYD